MNAARRAATLLALLFSGFVLTSTVLAGAAAADPTDPTSPTATATPTATPTSTSSTERASDPTSDATSATDPTGPTGPTGTSSGSDVEVNLKGLTDKPTTSVSVIITLTLLSLLPAIVLTCTSFTKILVVLGLTRNALGLQQTPPNQVLAGLALFLSVFIMGPVLAQMNHDGLQPYMHGTKTTAQAWHEGSKPLLTFMLKNTDDEQIQLLTSVAKRKPPTDRADTPMSTLVPAFVLSELKQAFIIGFIVFIPFLVIDIVVSGVLMALGMMMMPPVMVSLPFKLLLFVMVDGWGLVIKALVSSYGT